MEQGSIAELVLTRSVTKHIGKQNKQLTAGYGVGHDFASMNMPDKEMALITTEGVNRHPEIAWIKAFNNFFVSGGKPLMARITIMLPVDTKESMIKDYMKCFIDLSTDYGVQLAGGHTEVIDGIESPVFTVHVTGVSDCFTPDKKSIVPGCEIIMVGYCAMLGTDIIAGEKREELRKYFSESYIDSEIHFEYNIKKATTCLAEAMGKDLLYMHDVSCGGVYAALWQLGAFAGRGLSVGHFDLPIKQSTIEFCEVFGINPYMLEGTGAMLAVVREGMGQSAVDALLHQGIPAAMIGHIESGNERMIYLGSSQSVSTVKKENPSDAAFYKDADDRYIERRCLSPIKGDELYKIIRKR